MLICALLLIRTNEVLLYSATKNYEQFLNDRCLRSVAMTCEIKTSGYCMKITMSVLFIGVK